MLRADEIREMSDADLLARVAELEEERFRLGFRSATEPLEDPLRLRTIRRDIARLKTIQRERELSGEPPTPAGEGAGGAKPDPARAAAGKAARKAATKGARKGGARKATRSATRSAGRKAGRAAKKASTKTASRKAGTRKTTKAAKGSKSSAKH
jgi:large subunit ribosomal protein L29